ncbi:MAG TPA: ferritin-like domain-containing protein [Longimicrobium sp.]|jgi:hypothetical protein
MQNQNITDAPLSDEAVSRRDALSLFGSMGAKLALAAAPLAVGLTAKAVAAQAAPTLTQILNFALTLEELEAEFYVLGLAAPNLIPAADRAIFENIRDHELSHVRFLRTALGTAAIAKPTFDFTGGKGSNAGPFPAFTNYDVFKVLAQGFEDLGVRAYKGQAPNLLALNQRGVLLQALRIHSVEARHASEVRRLRGNFSEAAPNKGWITGVAVDTAAAPIAGIYAAGAAGFPAEDNTTHGGLNVSTVTSVAVPALTEAWDEPLDMARVVTLASMFIV